MHHSPVFVTFALVKHEYINIYIYTVYVLGLVWCQIVGIEIEFKYFWCVVVDSTLKLCVCWLIILWFDDFFVMIFVTE